MKKKLFLILALEDFLFRAERLYSWAEEVSSDIDVPALEELVHVEEMSLVILAEQVIGAE